MSASSEEQSLDLHSSDEGKTTIGIQNNEAQEELRCLSDAEDELAEIVR